MPGINYLKSLGVTQYRRRELITKARLQPAAPFVDNVSAKKIHHSAAPPSQDNGDLQLRNLTGSKQGEESKQGVYNPAQTAFELLLWQVPNLLILEFSSTGLAQFSQKHQLANNILRAIWPRNFRGTGVNQHIWPMPGLQATRSSAIEWLSSMISGHLQQYPECPIWLMGSTGIDLLFPASCEDRENLNLTKVKHADFKADFLITPTLSEMFDNPVAKATSWQLLKLLRHP